MAKPKKKRKQIKAKKSKALILSGKKPVRIMKTDWSDIDAIDTKYRAIKRSFTKSDFMEFCDAKTGEVEAYTCKGGWRKVAAGFALSGRILDRRKVVNPNNSYTWIYYIKVEDPFGRFWEAEGSCSSTNRFFTKGGNIQAQESDIIHMAQTCGYNRAISDMVGGETSAEEMLAMSGEDHLRTVDLGEGNDRRGKSNGNQRAMGARRGPAGNGQGRQAPPAQGYQQPPDLPRRGDIAKDPIHLKRISNVLAVAKQKNIAVTVMIQVAKRNCVTPKWPDYVRDERSIRYLYPEEVASIEQYLGITFSPTAQPVSQGPEPAAPAPAENAPVVHTHEFGKNGKAKPAPQPEPPAAEPPAGSATKGGG